MRRRWCSWVTAFRSRRYWLRGWRRSCCSARARWTAVAAPAGRRAQWRAKPPPPSSPGPCRRRRLGARHVAAVLGDPGGELRRRDDLDRDRHEAVARAAKLRALAEIDARPVDLGPGLVKLAGIGVLLDPESRHREAVDHVVGGDDELHDLAGWDAPADCRRRAAAARRHWCGRAGWPGASDRSPPSACSCRTDAIVGQLIGPIPLVPGHLDREVGRRR